MGETKGEKQNAILFPAAQPKNSLSPQLRGRVFVRRPLERHRGPYLLNDASKSIQISAKIHQKIYNIVQK